MTDKKRAHVWISGRVQGVCYRLETRREADRVGISGWVRNLPDGRVEAVFEGSGNQVASMIEWCRQGPAIAAVTDVAVSWEEAAEDLERFEITY